MNKLDDIVEKSENDISYADGKTSRKRRNLLKNAGVFLAELGILGSLTFSTPKSIKTEERNFAKANSTNLSSCLIENQQNSALTQIIDVAKINSYNFNYKTAVLNKTWFSNGYVLEYKFKDGVTARLAKISNKSIAIPQANKEMQRVGKAVVGKYVKNGFEVSKQTDISDKALNIKINNGETGFYWWLEGKGTAVDPKYMFNWASLFKNRALTPEGIYSTPILGYNTTGWFLTPSPYWDFSVLNGDYGGKNVWLRKDLGWAFYYYPQLVSLVYVQLIPTNKVMYTQPASSYLKKLYNFGEKFYDTRFNTDLGNFLVSIGQSVNEPADLWAARKYQDYLLTHANKYRWIVGDGILVADYSWSGKPSVITHASLNHNLAEINFLLRLGDSSGISLAQKILKGIKSGEKDWMLQGDLNYAYYGPKEGYHGKDYKVLTLRDLKVTKTLLSDYDWGEQYIPTIEHLIQCKEGNH